jgi:hypothetical protein
MSVAERSSPKQVQLALIAFVALLGLNCKDEPPPQKAPQVLQMTDTQGLPRARVALMREAVTEYDIGPERPPLAIRDTAFPGPSTDGETAPQMTIATLRLKARHSRPSGHQLIARIKSNGNYPAMGIHTGLNFIWRNSWDSTAAARWVTKVIPMHPSAPDYTLHRDSRLHEYTSGDAAEPRLVRVTKASFAFATCLEDPMCGSGHCGYW